MDAYWCRQIVRGRVCGEMVLQLVDQATARAFLLCPACHHRVDIVPREAPPIVHWRSLTVTKPCLYPACRGLVTVPVSHPERVKYCTAHPDARQEIYRRNAARRAEHRKN